MPPPLDFPEDSLLSALMQEKSSSSSNESGVSWRSQDSVNTKKGDKIDYSSILFCSANKNSSLRIKLSLLPWQRSAHKLPLRQALTAGTTLLCISTQTDVHAAVACEASEISVGFLGIDLTECGSIFLLSMDGFQELFNELSDLQDKHYFLGCDYHQA